MWQFKKKCFILWRSVTGGIILASVKLKWLENSLRKQYLQWDLKENIVLKAKCEDGVWSLCVLRTEGKLVGKTQWAEVCGVKDEAEMTLSYVYRSFPSNRIVDSRGKNMSNKVFFFLMEGLNNIETYRYIITSCYLDLYIFFF